MEIDVLLGLSLPLLGLGFEGLESLFEAPDPGFGFGLVEIYLTALQILIFSTQNLIN